MTLDLNSYNEVAENVLQMLGRTPYLQRGPYCEREMLSGSPPQLDVEHLCSTVSVRLSAYFRENRYQVQFDCFDPWLVAARIVSELIPARYLCEDDVGKLVSLDTIAKRIARTAGVPRSALQQQMISNADWVHW